MFRNWLCPVLILPLVLTGAVGLHTHEDGTCHTHPFAPGEEHPDENGTIPCEQQLPGDGACVRNLFPTADGICPDSSAPPAVAAARGSDEGPSDDNSYLLACGPPGESKLLPIYLLHRRLLL